MTSCRLVALDKAPGVRPVGIGYINLCLLTNFVLSVTGDMETEACGNLNPCSGLGASIEVSVHTTLNDYIKARCPPAADQALLTRGEASDKGLRGAGKSQKDAEDS